MWPAGEKQVASCPAPLSSAAVPALPVSSAAFSAPLAAWPALPTCGQGRDASEEWQGPLGNEHLLFPSSQELVS